MTDKERKEIFEHRADHRLRHETLMSYTGFKCALADAERRFADASVPTPSDPAQPMQSNCSVCADKDREIERLSKNIADEVINRAESIENSLLRSELAESKRRVEELEEKVQAKEVLLIGYRDLTEGMI